jgi:hypothetical protein
VKGCTERKLVESTGKRACEGHTVGKVTPGRDRQITAPGRLNDSLKLKAGKRA